MIDFVWDLWCIKYTQVKREKSSTIVRKTQDSFIVFIDNGPQMSQWMISNWDFVQVWLTGKGNLCCFDRGHTTHMLFEFEQTLWIKVFNKASLD